MSGSPPVRKWERRHLGGAGARRAFRSTGKNEEQ